MSNYNTGALIGSDFTTINLHAYYVYGSKNFPECREQFSWCNEGNDFFLFGGIVSNKSNMMWNLNPVNLEWKKIDPGLAGNLRYGHTGTIHLKKFYLFGGKYANYPVMGDLEIFNLETSSWSTPSLFTSSTLKLRRNHVAVDIGQHILIHGGISEAEEYLGDCYLLNYSPLKWVHVNISPDCDTPVLAWHSACLVLPNDQKYSPKLTIYKLPEQGIARRSFSRIKDKGVYFFGGKSSEDGLLKNDMWVLKIGKKPLDWVKLETNGEPPRPRYAHSMNFYEEGNYLIIHGGRNDYSSSNFALNDTFILELFRLDWIKVNLCFDAKTMSAYNRCGHSSVIYSNILIYPSE
jgi:hypothetical protein